MRKQLSKRIVSLCLAVSCAIVVCAQSWTSEELRAANTAGSCSYLSQVEKDVILYNNLARMYPAKFARIELRGQQETGYLSSLRNDLNSMSALPALTVHRGATEAAKCWATESGSRGITGHRRVGCDDFNAGHAWGENCSYGKSTGRDIILQLLIDEGISNLGHRRNCLSSTFRSVGVGYATHTGYRYCCVMDFTDESGTSYNAAVSTGGRVSGSGGTAGSDGGHEKDAPSSRRTTPTITAAPAPSPRTTTTPAPRTTTTPAPRTTTTPAPTTTTPAATTTEPTGSLLERYYAHSGYHMLSYLSVGYTYSVMGKTHLMTFSALDFRVSLFSMSWLSTELAISPLDTRVAYKPSVRVYIPVAKNCAVVPYGGAAIDMSGLGKFVSKDFNYNTNRDFYASAIAGVAVNLSAAKRIPLELKVEYRHPIVVPTAGTLSPQGIYLGAQLYLGSTFDKK